MHSVDKNIECCVHSVRNNRHLIAKKHIHCYSIATDFVTLFQLVFRIGNTNVGRRRCRYRERFVRSVCAIQSKSANWSRSRRRRWSLSLSLSTCAECSALSWMTTRTTNATEQPPPPPNSPNSRTNVWLVCRLSCLSILSDPMPYMSPASQRGGVVCVSYVARGRFECWRA